MSKPQRQQDAPGSGVVAARNVGRTFYLGEPVHALRDVSLTLEEGSFTAVMGPSGSGKSTLMNLLGCLDTPDRGTIEIDGRSVGDLSGAERARLRGTKIGFVFQTFNLMPRLTAAENVTLPMVFNNVVKQDRRERAENLLNRVGLGDRLDHAPNELSGGQRQRVAIARALANEPTLILADEPTGNLDSETGADIMELFEELHDEGRTILMVTHERHIAERAERIVHLLDGELDYIEDASDVVPSGPATAGPDVDSSGDGNGRDPTDDAAGRESTEETADRHPTDETDAGDGADGGDGNEPVDDRSHDGGNGR